MKEAPKLEVGVAKPMEEFAATEEAVQERSDLGGQSLDRAVQDGRMSRDAAAAVDLRGKLENQMVEAKPEAVAPINFSAIRANIDTMSKEEMAGRGTWSKIWNGKEEAERFTNLRKGLTKIESASQFAENYQRALAKKGEEQAMRYLEIIGSGKLARVDEDGEFVSNSVGTRDGGGLMGHI